MICVECRIDAHSLCEDLRYPRPEEPPPGVTPGTGRWCDCQHWPREPAS